MHAIVLSYYTICNSKFSHSAQLVHKFMVDGTSKYPHVSTSCHLQANTMYSFLYKVVNSLAISLYCGIPCISYVPRIIKTQ